MARGLCRIALAVLLLGGAGSAMAEAGPEAGVPPQADTSEKVDSGAAAARVYVDPATGRIGRPPPGTMPRGDTAAGQRGLDRSHEGLEAQVLPDGTRLLHLQGRFQHRGHLTIDAAGEQHLTCKHAFPAAADEREASQAPMSDAARAGSP